MEEKLATITCVERQTGTFIHKKKNNKKETVRENEREQEKEKKEKENEKG